MSHFEDCATETMGKCKVENSVRQAVSAVCSSAEKIDVY